MVGAVIFTPLGSQYGSVPQLGLQTVSPPRVAPEGDSWKPGQQWQSASIVR